MGGAPLPPRRTGAVGPVSSGGRGRSRPTGRTDSERFFDVDFHEHSDDRGSGRIRDGTAVGEGDDPLVPPAADARARRASAGRQSAGSLEGLAASASIEADRKDRSDRSDPSDWKMGA